MAEAVKKPWRVTIRVTVVGMFLAITTFTAAVAIGLQFYFSASLAERSALTAYAQTAEHTREFLSTLDAQATVEVRMLAARQDLVDQAGASDVARAHLADTLRRNPTFYSAYLGFDNGDLYQLVNLDSGARVRERLDALPRDRWVMITITADASGRQRRLEYLDESFELRASRVEPTSYRADRRPWFQQARSAEVHKTEPYLFEHLQSPGRTYARRLEDDSAVLGIDITLDSLSSRLARHKTSPESRLYLFQPDGALIASSEHAVPPLELPPAQPLALTPEEEALVAENPRLMVSNELDWPPFDFAVSGAPRGYAIDMLGLVSGMTGLEFRYVNGYGWPELLDMFREGRLDMVHPVLATPAIDELGARSVAFVDAPFGVLTRPDVPPITRIGQLVGKRVAIPGGWSSIENFRRLFPEMEIVEVAGARGLFEAVRSGVADAGIDNAAPLRYNARQFFVEDLKIHAPLDFGDADVPTGLHYLLHPDRAELLPLIDRALKAVTPTQREVLERMWLLESQRGGVERTTVPDPALVAASRDPAGFGRLQEVSLSGAAHYLFLEPVGMPGEDPDFFAVVTSRSAVLGPALSEVRKSVLITALLLVFVLPLSYALARFIVRPVRELAQENEKIRNQHYADLVRVRSHIVEIDDLGASLMRMGRAIERHVHEQQALMDSFVELIAQAIDQKSPYTGGHCRRVPELAIMLARKAEESDQPPFANFGFRDENAWREFRIGAWLHDCGKITTPEHIVDKGVKLETIHNRIHEIRTRFEVLHRDATIRYLERCLHSPRDEPAARAQRDETQRRLQEDFAFVAGCNDGSIPVDPAVEQRLDAIGAITWQRHFDDRLGLAPLEAARRGPSADNLPVREPLLADKPWHIIERPEPPDYDPRLGIRMTVPEHLYNLGELYNLKIPRGTLTPEDRFKIQEHIIGTIRMLDQLPLPEELSRVPRYASTHHETLDGRGYPRGLTAEDLSIPERIMILADIFEALTAADRPYKPPMPISQAIGILHRMVQDQHVDPDVFALFLTSGAYLEYAHRYLAEEQIDEVVLDRFIAPN
ncbi:MAG: HD domain-containing phosphohydrolase [Halothiobacillaceae bacterium]